MTARLQCDLKLGVLTYDSLEMASSSELFELSIGQRCAKNTVPSSKEIDRCLVTVRKTVRQGVAHSPAG
jgi:hypothetical protein